MPNWNNYSRYFRREPVHGRQETALVNYLKNLEFDSVLEVGCGFGRVTEALHKNFHPKRFLSIDEADDIRRYNDVEFIKTPLQMMPESEKFDLVIAVEVLMHTKLYKPLLEKMKKLSKKHVVHLDYWEKEPTWQLDPDLNWLHDYEGKKTQISKNQAIFHYEITNNNTKPKGHPQL